MLQGDAKVYHCSDKTARKPQSLAKFLSHFEKDFSNFYLTLQKKEEEEEEGNSEEMNDNWQ